MIGTSDGEQYEDTFDHSLSLHGMADRRPEKPTGSSKSNLGTQLPSEFPQAPGPDSFHIDRTKDVPLAASALHKDGQFYGIAVDKDAPKTDLGIPGWDPAHGVFLHERAEFDHMNNLIKSGMSTTDAYHEAHDKIATPTETAYVRAVASMNGKDPDKFHEEYKQYWRDVTSNSTAKEDPDRHPDAHTTTHGLDESELGKKYAVFRGVKGAAQTMTDASPEPINPMTPSYIQPHPGGRTGPMPWYRGAEGKWRQEIPDNKSKLTLDKARQAFKDSGVVTLGDTLHHPELYESYPSIKNIKIFKDSDKSLDHASYHPSVDKIVVGPHSSEEQLRSTLLHEIQHAIQTREGFTAGSSPKAMVKPVAKAMDNKGLDAADYDSQTLMNTMYDAYSHVSGEVEARNVERRKDWPTSALRMFKPTSTQEYPFEEQLNPPID